MMLTLMHLFLVAELPKKKRRNVQLNTGTNPIRRKPISAFIDFNHVTQDSYYFRETITFSTRMIFTAKRVHRKERALRNKNFKKLDIF